VCGGVLVIRRLADYIGQNVDCPGFAQLACCIDSVRAHLSVRIIKQGRDSIERAVITYLAKSERSSPPGLWVTASCRLDQQINGRLANANKPVLRPKLHVVIEIAQVFDQS
jgi:hypothetical protein